MLFGEQSGQKGLKLKMDKICRTGPFRITQPKCVNVNAVHIQWLLIQLSAVLTHRRG